MKLNSIGDRSFLHFNKILLSTALLICINSSCFSQDLLVNPSFEDVNICTEYNAPCCPAGWFSSCLSGDNYILHTNYHHDVLFGDAYAIVPIFNYSYANYRDYLESGILCPLQKGRKYSLSFWIGDKKYKEFKIGIFFGDRWIFMANPLIIRVSPAIVFTQNDVISKIKYMGLVWYHVKKDFVSKDNAGVIIIGNFFDDETTKEFIPGGRKRKGVVYYAIDSIDLAPVNGSSECIVDYRDSVKDNLYAIHERHYILKQFQNLALNNIPKHDTGQVMVKPDTNKVTPKLVTITDTLRVPDILFETDKSDLKENYTQYLDSLGRKIVNTPYSRIKIIGYTDSRGTLQYNMELSYRRAKAVADYLVAGNWISSEHLQVYGEGENNPIASNETMSGRQQNRRVEIVMFEVKNKYLKP